jgi:hypothetical protein
MRLCLCIGGVLTSAFAPVAAAQPGAEVPGAVAVFEQICLSGGVDPAARSATLGATGWQQDASVHVDIQRLGISKSIDRNYDFSKADSASQWSGQIDNRQARIVLASFPEKRRYRNLCALVIDDVANAMPYGDSLKAAFKAFGIGGKSVDLVHYFEFAGKLGTEKHPARGEIFTRSLASGGRNSMHIYVAY